MTSDERRDRYLKYDYKYICCRGYVFSLCQALVRWCPFEESPTFLCRPKSGASSARHRDAWTLTYVILIQGLSKGK